MYKVNSKYIKYMIIITYNIYIYIYIYIYYLKI